MNLYTTENCPGTNDSVVDSWTGFTVFKSLVIEFLPKRILQKFGFLSIIVKMDV
jgi:hypothetical protein